MERINKMDSESLCNTDKQPRFSRIFLGTSYNKPIMIKICKYCFGLSLPIGILLCSASCHLGDEEGNRVISLQPVKDVNREQKNALQAVNYINWLCALVNPGTFKNYQFDQIDLELAYQSLTSDELNLNSIPDSVTVGLIKEIETYILRLRIAKEEQALLEETYKREKRKAFFSALPANMAVIVDANWKQILANVAQTLFYSYMNYRKIKECIEIQHQKDSWELDKSILEVIHDKNQALLEHQWRIIKDFKIDDKRRITETSAIRLLRNIQRANSNSNEARHIYNILKDEESAYEYLPVYWYYRGCYAYSHNPSIEITSQNKKDKQDMEKRIREAQECFKRYQEIASNLFRKCPMSADVAIRRIQLEIIGSTGAIDKSLIREQLEIIDRNIVPEKDEDKALFCGLVYLKLLDDPARAAVFFQKAEEYLRIGYKDSLNDFINMLEEGSVLKLTKKSVLVYDVTGKVSPLEIPGNDLLFFSRFSKYYSLIQANSEDFVHIIQQLSTEPETSLLEILFYGANVKTIENMRKYYTVIIPQVLGAQISADDLTLDTNIYSKPVGASGLPYPLENSLTYHYHWISEDTFEFVYPLDFFSLQDVKYRLELQPDSQVIFHSAFQKESPMVVRLLKGGQNDLRQYKVSFEIPLDEKKILKSRATHLRFVIEHKLFQFYIDYAVKDLQKANGSFVDGKTVKGTMLFNINHDEVQKLKSSLISHPDRVFFNSRPDSK